MQKIKLLIILGMLLTQITSSYASLSWRNEENTYPLSFNDDEELVNLLKAKKMRLIVMRHGQAVSNLEDLTTSNRSPGLYLTPEGIDDVKLISQELLNQNIEVIYVSPLYRALQTAQLVGDGLSLSYQSIIADERLRQQNFGIFEGKTYQDYKNYFHTNHLLYEQGSPGGESGTAIFERTHRFLWQIAVDYHQTVLIITHAFNYCYIKKCLTDEFGDFPELAHYVVFDYSQDPVKANTD